MITKKLATKKYVKYHNDGTVWAKGQMRGKVMEGFWQFFRKDGVITRSGFFTHGKQTGKWTTYDKKGRVYKVIILE